jgi:uncharacterized membrane protein HdeD (DUF308 family)
MEKNEGMIDRVVRVILGVVLILGGVYVSLSMANWLGWIAVLVGLVLLVTGAVGVCPLYKVLGISTNKK